MAPSVCVKAPDVSENLTELATLVEAEVERAPSVVDAEAIGTSYTEPSCAVIKPCWSLVLAITVNSWSLRLTSSMASVIFFPNDLCL